MDSLKRMQRAMNKFSKDKDYEVFQAIKECNEMLQNDGDKRAVKAFYEMAEHFFGEERMTAGLALYGFTELKEVVR